MQIPRRAALALSLAAAAARAEPATYRLAAGQEGPGIEVRLPYSVGTHEVRATAVAGEVRFDPDAPSAGISGALTVALAALAGDRGARDCHMREALGLDYSRSRYPKDHVCGDGDRLPESGPDAVAFPEIRLELTGAQAPPLAELAVDREAPAELTGAWTLHGVSRPARLALRLSRDAATPGALRVKGEVQLRLADFGVQVKSARVLFVTISTGETATVLLDLKLVPARR